MMREFRRLLKEKGRDDLPRVLLAAAECAPLAKPGGLADVIGALPKSLTALGVDARVIMPDHRVTKENFGGQAEHMFSFFVHSAGAPVFWRGKTGAGRRHYLPHRQRILLWRQNLPGRPRGGRAIRLFHPRGTRRHPPADFSPDILHCNDWHTGMLPMLIKTQYGPGEQEHLKTLLTIQHRLSGKL
jgi:starch synthase